MIKNLGFEQFKRDAKSGRIALQQITSYGKPATNQLPCKIGRVQTKSFTIMRGDQKSWLEVDYASLFTYTGDTVCVYRAGLRPLNTEELEVLNKWKQIESTPAYKEQLQRDALTDGSQCYWKEKHFFEMSKFPYLFGTSGKGSKRLVSTKEGYFILDSAIKGDCILSYKVIQI